MGKKEQKRGGATAGGNAASTPPVSGVDMETLADRPEAPAPAKELSPEQKAALLKTIRDDNQKTARELRESLQPVDMTLYGALLEETYFG